jgi:hypothetical protein
MAHLLFCCHNITVLQRRSVKGRASRNEVAFWLSQVHADLAELWQ